LFGVLAAMRRRRPVPLVILLEDLHWADDESLAMLSWLIHESLPILIVGTYRADEAPYLPEHLPDARRMKLNCLPESAVAELSQLMLGSQGARPEVMAYLQRETEGNVFFLVEAARALAHGEPIDVVG
jgi:predicted ATPase